MGDSENQDNDQEPTVHVRGKTLKLPYFNKSKDCMDSYLYRFKRFTEMQEWHQRDIAVYLSALSKGTALEMYSRMPAAQSASRADLKKALFRRFELTEEGFKI